jgi:hypothetical protein
MCPLGRESVGSLMTARKERFVAASGVLVILLVMLSTLLLPADIVNALIDDDSWIESSGAIALLVGSVFLFWGFVRLRRAQGTKGRPTLLQLSVLGLAIFFFFGFGEEISWGQRIVGFSPPESILKVNSQHEFNVHNLKYFHGALNTDRIFAVIWFFLVAAIPVASMLSTAARRKLRAFVPIFPLLVAGLLVADEIGIHLAEVVLDGRYYNPDSDNTLTHATEEIKEAVGEISVALGAFWVFVATKHGSADALDPETDTPMVPVVAQRREAASIRT